MTPLITFATLPPVPVLPELPVTQTVSDDTFKAIALSLGCGSSWRDVGQSRIFADPKGGFFQHFYGTDMFRWEAAEPATGERRTPVAFERAVAITVIDAFLKDHFTGNGVDVSGWRTAAPCFEATCVAAELTLDTPPTFVATLMNVQYQEGVYYDLHYLGARLSFALAPDASGAPEVVRCFRYFRTPVIAASAQVVAAAAMLRPPTNRSRRVLPRIMRTRRAMNLVQALLESPSAVKDDVRSVIEARFPIDGMRIRVESVVPAYFQAPPFIAQKALTPVWVVRGTITPPNAGPGGLERRPFRIMLVPSRAVATLSKATLEGLRCSAVFLPSDQQEKFNG